MKNVWLRIRAQFKWDIVFLLLITLGIVCSFIFVVGIGNDGDEANTNTNTVKAVLVTIEGNLYNSYPLSEDADILIENEYGFNRIWIKDGIVSVIEADCEGGECIQQSSISKNGESIICLPHRMVISVSSDEEAEYDSIAY